jgi:hypothetical protein
MECPKCGYDRQPEDTHCELCGVDFGLLERQAAEKKQLKKRALKSAEKKSSKQKLEMEVTEPEILSQESPVSRECPKCGADRKDDDVECPRCGVIYKKHEQLLAQQLAEKEAAKKAVEQRLLEKKAQIQKEAEEAIAKAKVEREAEARKLAEKDQEIEKPEPEDGKKFYQEITDALNKVVVRLKGNAKKIAIYTLIVFLVFAVGWGAVTLVRNRQESAERERLADKQREEQQRLEQKQKKSFSYFCANQDELTSYFKSLIDQREFDRYTREIKKYEIPSLEGDLDEIKKYFEEIKIFDSAKQIPGQDYEKNYDIYSQLCKMDPENKVYQEEWTIYRKKLAEKNYLKAMEFLNKKNRIRSDLTASFAAIDRSIQLEGEKEKYNKIKYELKNAELLFYEGNENVQMAVRDDGLTKGATGGQRKLYVWLKNVGTSPFFVNVEYFTLVVKNEKRYSYNNCSRELIVHLQPGQETGGFLYFYTSFRPAKLIFSHISAGTVSRIFP